MFSEFLNGFLDAFIFVFALGCLVLVEIWIRRQREGR
jgi:hypothetical protein